MSNIGEAGTSLALPKPISLRVKLGQSFVVMPHGLAVEGQPSLDEWLEVGALLDKASDSVHWWIGDWLNYGMEHYEIDGEKPTYDQAMEMLEERGLNFSYGTLRQDKYVAGAVPLSMRIDKLKWNHHLLVAPLPPEQQQYWLNYAEEHKLTTRELRAAIKGAKDLPWLRYTDVWNFSECDDRFGMEYPGRIPGQIVQNILYYYTDDTAFVIDPMAGGGTTLDVCLKCDEVKRECLAFDKEPKREDILETDATQPWPTKKQADLIFIDPPYGSQLEKQYGGMAGKPIESFLADMEQILSQAKQNIKGNGLLALLIAPMAIKTDYIDLPFILYKKAEALGFRLKRRIHVPVGSQQVGPAVTKQCKDTRTMVAIARDLLILRRG